MKLGCHYLDCTLPFHFRSAMFQEGVLFQEVMLSRGVVRYGMGLMVEGYHYFDCLLKLFSVNSHLETGQFDWAEIAVP